MAGVSILSYLHYLHDVNRKLLQRGGLENVLYRKPVSQHPYYHQLDQSDSARPRHWLGSLRHIQNAEARGLALRPLVGLGLVVGQAESLRAATHDGRQRQGRFGRAPAGSRQVPKPADDCLQPGVLRLPAWEAGRSARVTAEGDGRGRREGNQNPRPRRSRP